MNMHTGTLNKHTKWTYDKRSLTSIDVLNHSFNLEKKLKQINKLTVHFVVFRLNVSWLMRSWTVIVNLCSRLSLLINYNTKKTKTI